MNRDIDPARIPTYLITYDPTHHQRHDPTRRLTHRYDPPCTGGTMSAWVAARLSSALLQSNYVCVVAAPRTNGAGPSTPLLWGPAISCQKASSKASTIHTIRSTSKHRIGSKTITAHSARFSSDRCWCQKKKPHQDRTRCSVLVWYGDRDLVGCGASSVRGSSGHMWSSGQPQSNASTSSLHARVSLVL